MNKKDKQEVTDIVTDVVTKSLQQLISGKKQVKQEKTEKTEEKSTIPAHKKADIPQLIQQMTTDRCKKIFGNISDKDYIPYAFKIAPFYKEYNIQLEDNGKYKESKTLNLEQKHLIIEKQLIGATDKQVKQQKQKHITHCNEKISNPPTTNIFGRVLTDKNIENIISRWNEELKRWNSAKTN